MKNFSEFFKQPKLSFFTRLLDDVPPHQRYKLAEQQVKHAEKFGYYTAWVAQHHFHPAEGGLPSPLVFLANLAAKTERIRLATGVITLPMENPIRVAEDIAVLDLLADSRIELGFGTGGTRESFAIFGIDANDRGTVYADHLQRLRAALSGDDLGHGNRLFPPAPHLLDRFWMATFSPLGGRLAGQVGDGLMLSRTQPRPPQNADAKLDDLQNPIIDAYLQALPSDKNPRIMVSRSLFVAEDRERAFKLAEIGLRKAAQRFASAGQPARGDKLEDLIRSFDLHVGTVSDVTHSLLNDSTLRRATEVAFQVHSVEPPLDDLLRSIELTATQVAPVLGLSVKRS